MQFELVFTDTAKQQLKDIEGNQAMAAVFKAVAKTLGLLSTNIRHPGLNTHKFDSIRGPNGEEVFEAYAQNRTPAAFRVFCYYGPGKAVITIFAITGHP
jgi:hypothetical protein